MYAFLLKWDPMRTPSHLGERIGSHFNKNAYMHEQTEIEFGVRIVGRKNLNWRTPFFAVSLCDYLDSISDSNSSKKQSDSRIRIEHH